MAQRSIREIDGKQMLSRLWNEFFPEDLKLEYRGVLIDEESDLNKIESENKWLCESNLVVKPDMLFGKRGKNGLVYYKNENPGDVSWEDAKKWIKEKSSDTTTLHSGQSGTLSHFIVEPFNPHSDEYYLSINLGDKYDEIFFSLQGGVDIEENWDSVLTIKLDESISAEEAHEIIKNELRKFTDTEKFDSFVCSAYVFFRNMHYTYLEFNPFVLEDDKIILLDLVAKVDDTAHFLKGHIWGDLEFPAPFGRSLTKEENYIKGIDANSGSSLKLTILNKEGKIWTLVAGGGASVVYAD
ncbi:ATPase, partial [bacterium]|nr:ATPase [bacterium]